MTRMMASVMRSAKRSAGGRQSAGENQHLSPDNPLIESTRENYRGGGQKGEEGVGRGLGFQTLVFLPAFAPALVLSWLDSAAFVFLSELSLTCSWRLALSGVLGDLLTW